MVEIAVISTDPFGRTVDVALGGPEPIPAQAGTMAALLDGLSLSTTLEEGAPAGTTAYLELLAEVLEDGVLTDDEATSLAALAKTYSLTLDQVDTAHRGFLIDRLCGLADTVIDVGGLECIQHL